MNEENGMTEEQWEAVLKDPRTPYFQYNMGEYVFNSETGLMEWQSYYTDSYMEELHRRIYDNEVKSEGDRI